MKKLLITILSISLFFTIFVVISEINSLNRKVNVLNEIVNNFVEGENINKAIQLVIDDLEKTKESVGILEDGVWELEIQVEKLNEKFKTFPTSQSPKIQPSKNTLNVNSIIPSVLKIECSAGQGSGTVIRTSVKKNVLTNFHVTTIDSVCVAKDWQDKIYPISFTGAYDPESDISSFEFTFDNGPESTIERSCTKEEIQIGEHITIFGFPGTDKIVIRDGYIGGILKEDGWGKKFWSTAKIDYGFSGGGTFLDNGCFAGIPSAMYIENNNSVIQQVRWE